MIPGDSYLVLLRYWVGNKSIQKQAIAHTPEKANKMAQNAYDFCVSNKHEYFIEVLPKFGQPVVYGSKTGLDRHKCLF